MSRTALLIALAIVAIQASYQEQQVLPGSLLPAADWSPVGRRLLYRDAGKCAVLDLDSGSAPVVVSDNGVRNARWAPDGEWILFETRGVEQVRRGVSDLIAVPVGGGAPEVLLEDSAALGFLVWSDDGLIHFWNRDTGDHAVLPPPGAWMDSYSVPDSVGPHLIQKQVPGIRGSVPHVFWPGAPDSSSTRLTDLGAHSGNLVIFQDSFPGRDRFLVRVHESGRSGDLVLDDAGRVVTDFRGADTLATLMRTAVSGDGRFIAAYEPRDDGHRYTSSDLYLIDVAGGERVPIAGTPMGQDPRLSPTGATIAFQGLDGAVHIGELAVTRR